MKTTGIGKAFSKTACAAFLLSGCSFNYAFLSEMYAKMNTNSTNHSADLDGYYDLNGSVSSPLSLQKRQRYSSSNRSESISLVIADLTKRVADSMEAEETLIKFITSLDASDLESAMDDFFEKDNALVQKDFLDYVLASRINVFVGWYKKALLIAAQSKDEDLSYFAKDTLDFYKNSFRSVV